MIFKDRALTRQVLVRKDCPICKGKECGCYDCGGKGYIEEWISIIEFINDFKYHLEYSKGIL